MAHTPEFVATRMGPGFRRGSDGGWAGVEKGMGAEG